MSDSNKSYRIRTNVGGEASAITFSSNIVQDYDNIELLSLNIGTENAYNLHTSDYGCVAGRVLANGGFGIPNAKISLFIEKNDDINDTVIEELYPYTSVNDENSDNIRYNLLPEEQLNDCHNPIGTFPSKRMMLDDNNVLEVFDTYYKFSTVSNDAGDYFLFGIPVGTQIFHTDIDLSDIGMLSQKPRDMVYKGYSITQFENANRFKQDTNLDNLTQVITQNDAIYVYPFWGEDDESGSVKITRNDIKVQYKFEPTCVFMGSMVSDDSSNGVSKKCKPTRKMGRMDHLTAGNGTIEMIRKKMDGSVESKEIQGNQLIDGNGVWCYQIPMNLDYITTDEYGNTVPSDNPEVGIPTRTRVRFRISLADTDSDTADYHLSKVLVPNNPKTTDDVDYVFGTNTLDDEFGTKSFRDLFWNNVYTVKEYIPRFQKESFWEREDHFTGFKNVNVHNAQNPIPYNNMRINLTFMFVLQCAMLKMLIKLIGILNTVIFTIPDKVVGIRLWHRRCATIGGSACPDLEGWYFAPKCKLYKDKAGERTVVALSEANEYDDKKSAGYTNKDKQNDSVCLSTSLNYFMQCVEINLAMENEVIQFDFYNDWMNGLVYLPRWVANIRKKKSFLFGLLGRKKMKIESCSVGTGFDNRRYVQQCALTYSANTTNGNYTEVVTNNGCSKSTNKQKCHTSQGRKHIYIFKNDALKDAGGIVHSEETLKKQHVYYFKPADWSHNRRTLMFATDIVLLGSLLENDKDGIPQAFKKLRSSSFQIPENLAMTNIDKDGNLYIGTGKETYCSGSNIQEDGVSTENTDFEGYKLWAKGQINYNEEPEETTEYAVTETSGIDWGYTGPNQQPNNLDTLTFQGGHFLGISCTSSQSNIKSCVNLSRVCEIGSSFSQRQAIASPYKQNNKIVGLQWRYLTPTGFISKDELSDSDFKSMFATMNHNALRTKRDNNTNFLKYDFVNLNPNNFNGELHSKLSDNTNYTSSSLINDDVSGTNSQIKAFYRTIEDNSNDYYNFRMGIDLSKDAIVNQSDDYKTSHYLIYDKSENTVALPQYENSFYFYFGIKDGSTAFDLLYKNYFAECPSDDDYAITCEITEKNNVSFCNGNDGSVTITQNNYETPYTLSLYEGEETIKIKEYSKDEYPENYDGYPIYKVDDSGEQLIYHTDKKFIITGLSNDCEYTIQTYGSNSEIIENIVTLDVDLPENVQNIIAEGVDYDIDKGITEGKVIITIPDMSNISDIILTNNEKYIHYNTDIDVSKYLNSDTILANDYSFTLTDDNDSGITIEAKVWEYNDTYSVDIIYSCNGDDKLINYQNIKVNKNNGLDILFTTQDLSFKEDLMPLGIDISTNNWFYKILKSKSNIKKTTDAISSTINDIYTSLSEKQMWCLKKALFFQKSAFTSNDDKDEEDIGIIITGGTPPYTVEMKGAGEMIDDDDEGFTILNLKSFNSVTESENSGYTLSYKGIKLPTYDIPGMREISYYYDTIKGNTIGFTKNCFESSKDDEKSNLNNRAPSYYKKTKSSTDDYTTLTHGYYELTIKDANNTELDVCLPSIYRPFYLNVVVVIGPSSSANTVTYWENDEEGKPAYSSITRNHSVRISYVITNGITMLNGENYELGNFILTLNGKNVINKEKCYRRYDDFQDSIIAPRVENKGLGNYHRNIYCYSSHTTTYDSNPYKGGNGGYYVDEINSSSTIFNREQIYPKIFETSITTTITDYEMASSGVVFNYSLKESFPGDDDASFSDVEPMEISGTTKVRFYEKDGISSSSGVEYQKLIHGKGWNSIDMNSFRWFTASNHYNAYSETWQSMYTLGDLRKTNTNEKDTNPYRFLRGILESPTEFTCDDNNYVLGIYDSYAKSGWEERSKSDNKTESENYVYHRFNGTVFPDTTQITILRLYSASEYNDIMHSDDNDN